jgi:predicted transposase YbfD/YdcC
MLPFSRLLDALKQIPDPRRDQGKRYPLPYLLLFSVLAILSGAKGFSDIILFIEQRLDALNAAFGSTLKRAPSINTVRVLLHTLDGDSLETALRRHAESLLTGEPAQMMPIIAVDGKTLRGSADPFLDRKAAHMLSAFATENAILLAHAAVDDKTNEIPCVQALIRDLGLGGVLYTGDGMQCQKKTFQAAAQTGSSVLVQVKANQPILLATLQDMAATRPVTDHHDTKDKIAHGRQERRVVDTFAVGDRLGADWEGLIAAAARVTRLTWHKDSATGLWHLSEDVSFYVCQTALSAKAFSAAIRGHWGVESHHYVRDVTFHEDDSRIRIEPIAFARLRSMALNVLRANGVKNVARALYKNAFKIENILSYSLS